MDGSKDSENLKWTNEYMTRSFGLHMFLELSNRNKKRAELTHLMYRTEEKGCKKRGKEGKSEEKFRFAKVAAGTA